MQRDDSKITVNQTLLSLKTWKEFARAIVEAIVFSPLRFVLGAESWQPAREDETKVKLKDQVPDRKPIRPLPTPTKSPKEEKAR